MNFNVNVYKMLNLIRFSTHIYTSFYLVKFLILLEIVRCCYRLICSKLFQLIKIKNNKTIFLPKMHLFLFNIMLINTVCNVLAIQWKINKCEVK